VYSNWVADGNAHGDQLYTNLCAEQPGARNLLELVRGGQSWSHI
jgi:hypothetical protein